MAVPLRYNAGGDETATELGGGEAKRRQGGELPVGDGVKHHEALGAVDRGRGEQSWVRTIAALRGRRESGPEDYLANGHHPDEPVGRAAVAAGSDRREKKLGSRQQQRTRDGPHGACHSRAAQGRCVVPARRWASAMPAMASATPTAVPSAERTPRYGQRTVRIWSPRSRRGETTSVAPSGGPTSVRGTGAGCGVRTDTSAALPAPPSASRSWTCRDGARALEAGGRHATGVQPAHGRTLRQSPFPCSGHLAGSVPAGWSSRCAAAR